MAHLEGAAVINGRNMAYERKGEGSRESMCSRLIVTDRDKPFETPLDKTSSSAGIALPNDGLLYAR